MTGKKLINRHQICKLVLLTACVLPSLYLRNCMKTGRPGKKREMRLVAAHQAVQSD